MSKALIIVDVQNDFCPGGALGVAGGARVAGAISSYLAGFDHDHVVATRDYHIDPGAHFSAEPDFVRSWPVHCRAGTSGAGFHPELDVAPIEAVFSKGQYSDGYSGFEGVDARGRSLATWLRERDVRRVDLVGIATEHCVRATALDAASEGWETAVLLELTAGLTRETMDAALRELADAGIALIGEPLLS